MKGNKEPNTALNSLPVGEQMKIHQIKTQKTNYHEDKK